MSRPRSGIHTYAGSYLRDGRYVEALTSPGVESLLGGPLETGIEAAWDAALHPDDRTTYREAISYATLVRGEPLDIEYRLVGSDGVTRWVWERVTPRPPRGEAVDVDGVIVDISERKEVNRVLEEHRFLSDALLMESGTDIFSGLYLPDGTYVDHYPAGIEHVLGRRLAPGEDGGEAWAAAVHPDDRAAVEALFPAYRAGQSGGIEYRLVQPDDSVRWVLERATPTPLPDGSVEIRGIMVDVTERRAIRAELDQARADLERVLVAHGTHVYRGRILPNDTYVEDSTGPGEERLLGGPCPVGLEPGAFWESRVHPDDLEAYRAGMRASRDDGTFELEYRLVGLDGVTRWLWDRGTLRASRDGVSEIDGLISDVTSRRAVADELREAHARLETALIDSRTHLFQCVTTPDGAYEASYVGPGAEHFLGTSIPPGEEMAELWRSRVHFDDRPSYDEGVAAQVAGDPTDMEYRLIGLDGVTRWVWERTHPRIEGDRLVTTGMIGDITARRAAEDDARAAHAHLERILEGVGQAVYTVDVERRTTIFGAGRWDHLLGRPPDRDVIALVRAAVHPADRERYNAGWASLAAGEVWDESYRLVGRDGVTRWVRERAMPRTDGDGRLVADGVLSDITAEHEAAIALAEAREQMARVVESVEEFLFTLVERDGELEVEWVGPGLERIVGGVPPDGAGIDTLWSRLVADADRSAILRQFHAVAGGEERALVVPIAGLDEVTRWAWIRSRPRVADGRRLIDSIVSDVTERRRAEEELEHASRIDALTGAFNRRHFVDVARGQLESETRERKGVGLLLLDLDHFKRVNDTHGHAVGDAVLVEAVVRIVGVLEPGETLARWGGEEFIVLLPGVGLVHARSRAEQVRAAIAASPFAIDGDSLPVTVSVGVATACGAVALDELADDADRALYAAKRRGRDRACHVADLVEADMIAEEPEAIRIAEAMARATAYREGVPEQHCHQVADLAARVAVELGLDAASVLRVRMGGFLHDVGKIAIPDRILTKPGQLDPAEWATMKSHTTIGRDLVLATSGLAPAADAVAHHHERWDGGGYPDGLAGERIPLDARIVAAVDAWSAMTEDRVYRAALSAGVAIEELRRSAGSHLDPRIVEALVVVLATDEIVGRAA